MFDTAKALPKTMKKYGNDKRNPSVKMRSDYVYFYKKTLTYLR